MAMLSILGLYNYRPDIFDGFQVPEHIDRNTVIETLCFDLAELSLVYSDPDTMKEAIRIWTNVNKPTWDALQETLEYEYNPIWNVDGTETETHKGSGKRDRKTNGSGETAASGADTNTNKVTGYNESDFTNNTQNTTEYGGKNNNTYNEGSDETYNDDLTITKTRGGNIGVTMTQQMIQAQRDVVQFNVTDVIVKSFKKKFCVMVY